ALHFVKLKIDGVLEIEIEVEVSRRKFFFRNMFAADFPNREASEDPFDRFEKWLAVRISFASRQQKIKIARRLSNLHQTLKKSASFPSTLLPADEPQAFPNAAEWKKLRNLTIRSPMHLHHRLYQLRENCMRFDCRYADSRTT